MQLHQQKGMISLSPPTICNSALVAGWLLRVTHSWAISGCLTRGLLTAYSRSGFSRSGLRRNR
nr:hypothetical protein [Escherichia coli]